MIDLLEQMTSCLYHFGLLFCTRRAYCPLGHVHLVWVSQFHYHKHRMLSMNPVPHNTDLHCVRHKNWLAKFSLKDIICVHTSCDNFLLTSKVISSIIWPFTFHSLCCRDSLTGVMSGSSGRETLTVLLGSLSPAPFTAMTWTLNSPHVSNMWWSEVVVTFKNLCEVDVILCMMMV